MRLTKEVKRVVTQEQPKSIAKTEELNKGRVEKRILKLYKPNGNQFKEWSRLNGIISIRRIRKDRQKVSDCIHYYITSLNTNNAEELLGIIRKHWWVENKLHYVKDVIMKEDYTKFRTYDRFKKNSIYRNVVFNFLKQFGFDSIKKGIEVFTNNVDKCTELLRT